MRHQNKVKKLGRDKSAREAMIISQAKTLIKHGKLTTTTARAKVTSAFVDKILAKAVSMEDQVAKYFIEQQLKDKDFANYVVEEVKPLVAKRASGFTSSYKLDFRKGDNSDMTMLVLLKEEDKKPKKSKSKSK